MKWFNVSKGYGFVTRKTGEDIFVHFRSIQGEGRRVLREGQAVEFTVTEGDKGPQAEDVNTL
ncbi:cold shock domain-containing protein [Oceanicoccus sp.]|uniref:cold-shock protein n=1 Tax=Oceanicoccus sp. TaxID=2691044 RepID=UPI00260EC6CE|nr:cold shock domain-containing protein [Oceanicoccus sp.]